MSNEQKYDVIIIGGSAGSLGIVMDLLDQLPYQINIPIIIVVHRLKNVQSEMASLFSSKQVIIEPEDKQHISNNVYLAPQNYHLLIEEDKSFSLDYSELVNYSRPSIDVSFMSIAEVYGSRSMGVLLSGANKDGTEGLEQIIRKGGHGIVQDPATAEYPVMPEAAIKKIPSVEILNPISIVSTIISSVK